MQFRTCARRASDTPGSIHEGTYLAPAPRSACTGAGARTAVACLSIGQALAEHTCAMADQLQDKRMSNRRSATLLPTSPLRATLALQEIGLLSSQQASSPTKQRLEQRDQKCLRLPAPTPAS